MNYIKIPINDLNKEKAVIYKYSSLIINNGDNVQEYDILDYSNYKELKEIPQITLNHYKRCFNLNKTPFRFAGITHILLADSLDISKYTVYNAK